MLEYIKLRAGENTDAHFHASHFKAFKWVGSYKRRKTKIKQVYQKLSSHDLYQINLATFYEIWSIFLLRVGDWKTFLHEYYFTNGDTTPICESEYKHSHDNISMLNMK